MEEFNKKLEEYLELYHEYFVEDIFDRGYKTTLFRDLIIYFSYREKENNKKVTLKYLAGVFQKRDHTSILKSINRTKEIINSHELLCYMYGADLSNIYLNLFYRFNIIHTKKK
ncbi:hypothetical protein NWE55_16820 (plasmid) [Myroides albus]|uniref:Uncharacterized protein n=1 Tax=Myroides odoratimimus TaxID=76832 RepID=A0AAI8G718_9FLAO|nr:MULTISPECIES: hypothetical protein [Myroides]ALU28486.1 hypothetical protein AS202_20115 [Myroides odoratimimus]UVD81424.1 hypothetical protein NWE55_16820 [Myroides albus]